jgi:hypothetical protein
MSHLIFTLDFHEMVRGKLQQNGNCTISYDPLRLASGKDGYVHGSSAFEFIAHLQFLPQGSADIELLSSAGIVEDPVIMNNGIGSMLSGDFTIPADAEEIIAWITMKDEAGNYTYDSDFGRNFHFRLATQDVQVTKAVVKNNETSGTASFTLTATSAAVIDKIIVRYRVINGADPLTENPVELERVKSTKKQQSWTTGDIVLPYGAVVVYDLIYCVGENNFKIENNGNYFIVPAT